MIREGEGGTEVKGERESAVPFTQKEWRTSLFSHLDNIPSREENRMIVEEHEDTNTLIRTLLHLVIVYLTPPCESIQLVNTRDTARREWIDKAM